MIKKIIPATILSDFYKITHRMFYPDNTTEIYSTWTPRSSEYFAVPTTYAVAFAFQMFVQKYLIDYFNENFFSRPKEEVIAEYIYVIQNTLGGEVDSSHIAALHDLGYLPLEIKALPEGTKAPIKVPTLTIRNTEPEFFWLTNYLETIMSSELWLPSNSATTASHYRALIDEYALKTTGSTAGAEFQGHDFSFRGMSGLDSSVASGLGHLLSFIGTDNIPAIVGAEMYYGANLSKELVGTSVPATEHSIMSSFGRDEEAAFNTIIDRVPSGIVSIVSDTYDFWNVLSTIIPNLKDKIMARDGKVVLRPDSGNPVDIICGTLHVDLNLNAFQKPEALSLWDYKEEIEAYVKETVDIRYNQRSFVTLHCDGEFFTIPWNFNPDTNVLFVDYDQIEKLENLTPEQKGAIQMLWETFGGTTSEQGFKVLDSHIGLLYGDAINLERARIIFDKLAIKGFASTNVVYGIGSFSYQFSTRDSLGYALKSTYAKIDGKETFIQKDPKTDTANLKKSLTGKVVVVRDAENGLKVIDHLNDEQEETFEGNLLQTIFKDGKAYNKITFAQVKQNLMA